MENVQINLEDVSLTLSSENKSTLCDIWPVVKQGLEILKDSLKNPLVKFAINILIKLGDNKLCPS